MRGQRTLPYGRGSDWASRSSTSMSHTRHQSRHGRAADGVAGPTAGSGAARYRRALIWTLEMERAGIPALFYFPPSANAASTSSLCLAGLTPVQTLATLPAGSIRKVLREATPRGPSDPYWSTIFLSVSESSLNVRLSLVQNSLWLSVESTLTPTITACFCSYFGRSC